MLENPIADAPSELTAFASKTLKERIDAEGWKNIPDDTLLPVVRFCTNLRLYQIGGYRKPKHGLLLSGPCGVGKTTLLKSALSKCLPERKQWFTAQQVIDEAVQYRDSLEVDRKYLTKSDLVLDDLGSEIEYNSYGNTYSLVEWIEWRYKAFVNYGSLTVFSTNATSVQELAEKYGKRIADRILEMTESVSYFGTSRRIAGFLERGHRN